MNASRPLTGSTSTTHAVPAQCSDVGGDSTSDPTVTKNTYVFAGHQHIGEVENRLDSALARSVFIVEQMFTGRIVTRPRQGKAICPVSLTQQNAIHLWSFVRLHLEVPQTDLGGGWPCEL